MPQGASNIGNNRFALLDRDLNISPASKKKRARGTPISEFPELLKVTIGDPKFVVLSSTNADKPLSSFSCFSVYRAIQLISKEIVSISELRDGNLLLLVKSDTVANKFIKAKELFGVCTIKCALHDKLNISKGTIYAPYLNNVPEDEIVKELSSQGVVSVYKFTRLVEGKQIPSGVLLVDFCAYNLPSKIDISWHSVQVKQYIPSPMRCKNCQLLGHTIKHCKNSSSCSGCNLPPHSSSPCTRTLCANCADSHPSNSKDCKKFLQQKEILTIKTQKKCTMKEAQKIYQLQIPNPITSTNESNISFSGVLRQSLPRATHNSTLQATAMHNKSPESTPITRSSNLSSHLSTTVHTNSNTNKQTTTLKKDNNNNNNQINSTIFNNNLPIPYAKFNSNTMDIDTIDLTNSKVTATTPNTSLTSIGAVLRESLQTLEKVSSDEEDYTHLASPK